MSVIVSTRTLGEVADWMNGMGYPQSIRSLAIHLHVGYNRAAEITRYGTRHGWFVCTRSQGRTVYYPTGSRPATEPHTGAANVIQPPADIPITFGIEAEMDFLRMDYDPDDPSDASFVETNECHSDAQAATNGWRSRADCTVGSEIISPVFRDLARAASSMRRQWDYWMGANEEDDHENVPYFVGTNPHGNNSISQHIHIGTSRSGGLSRTEKVKIANLVLMEYPLVIAVTANSPRHGYMSYRMGHINAEGNDDGGFARSMGNFDRSISSPSHGTGDAGHYEEISDSYHGTVEFRGQDSCTPQATLTASFLLQSLARKAVQMDLDDTVPSGGFKWGEYSERREHACKESGPFFDERRSYVEELVGKIGNVSLDELPASVKEILTLGLHMGVWPARLYDALADTAEKKFEWFQRLTLKPKEFLGVILEMEKITPNQKLFVRGLIESVRMFRTLADLKDQMLRYPMEIPAASEEEAAAEAAAQSEVTFDGVGNDYFHHDPENGWFRLIQLNAEQRLQAAEITRCLEAVNGQSMTLSRMLASPDRFWIQVQEGRVVDAWVWGRRRAEDQIDPASGDNITAINERHEQEVQARARLSASLAGRHSLHGLTRTGCWPWPCAVCHSNFQNQDEHIRYAVENNVPIGDN